MRAPFDTLLFNQHCTVAYFGNSSGDLYLIEKDKEFAPEKLLELQSRSLQLGSWLRTAQVTTAILSILLLSWFGIGTLFDSPGLVDDLAVISVWFFSFASTLSLAAGLLLWAQCGSVAAEIVLTRTHLRSLNDSYISGPAINDITPALRDELWPMLAADAPEKKTMLAIEILNFVDAQYDNRACQLEEQSKDRVAEIFTDSTGLEVTASAWKQRGIENTLENTSAEAEVPKKKTPSNEITEGTPNTDAVADPDSTEESVQDAQLGQ